MRKRFRAPKHRRGKYKSRLELFFATLCFKAGLGFEYEANRIPYTRLAHYVPDWKIAPNVYIETKGYLAPANRSNILSFKEQHPDIRVLLLFANADNKLNAKSQTSYGEWATKNGVEWADIRKGLPTHWWTKYAEVTNPVTNTKKKTKS